MQSLRLGAQSSELQQLLCIKSKPALAMLLLENPEIADLDPSHIMLRIIELKVCLA